MNDTIQTHDILFHATGLVIKGLEIQETYDGERDKQALPAEYRHSCMGTLKEPGGILFKTAAGRNWVCKFNEFAFVFQGTKTQD